MRQQNHYHQFSKSQEINGGIFKTKSHPKLSLKSPSPNLFSFKCCNSFLHFSRSNNNNKTKQNVLTNDFGGKIDLQTIKYVFTSHALFICFGPKRLFLNIFDIYLLPKHTQVKQTYNNRCTELMY